MYEWISIAEPRSSNGQCTERPAVDKARDGRGEETLDGIRQVDEQQEHQDVGDQPFCGDVRGEPHSGDQGWYEGSRQRPGPGDAGIDEVNHGPNQHDGDNGFGGIRVRFEKLETPGGRIGHQRNN